MRFTTLQIAALSILASTTASAFDASDIQKLKFTNECRACDLSNANFKGVDLSNADLTEANLSSAKLAGSNFSQANLTDANLSEARGHMPGSNPVNFTGTQFKGAKLDDAILRRANLTDADFTSVKSMQNTNLESATLCRTLFSWGIAKPDCGKKKSDKEKAFDEASKPDDDSSTVNTPEP
ncbi:MAG: pentapeptide repeat-containing protein [Gammaproteobacteria bacterium]|jgi:uncharacterized protein YjbI with pentapeptide repeats|nr:pentapeptide repeat-containing protein [Gammaproteobacteria bacterium]MBT5371294.1 pentapeptide repeat-containing protein [Gammaproteobacteria bacterium]MBT6479398.1 pentapeptide repeat-containing protein [Gammaproteobacteria bacterium]MBT7141115.1 pentapeptide repeat-containing protein [Gammaproteobacteria bacterium]MBT7479941.1 pentapeptide repeat-containing protein [Gammaproteobacteria bacterium]